VFPWGKTWDRVSALVPLLFLQQGLGDCQRQAGQGGDYYRDIHVVLQGAMLQSHTLSDFCGVGLRLFWGWGREKTEAVARAGAGAPDDGLGRGSDYLLTMVSFLSMWVKKELKA
jgi:hypothetical protein